MLSSHCERLVRLLTMDCVVLQNEKCHLLIENETIKLKHLDEQNNQLLKEWRDQLKPRKKVRATRLRPYQLLLAKQILDASWRRE